MILAQRTLHMHGTCHVARMVVVILVFAAILMTSTPLSAEPTGTFTDDQTAKAGENLPVMGVKPEPSMPTAPIIYPDAVTLGEIENRLRREWLDDRARTLDQWLTVVVVVLAFFAIIIPILGVIVGYVGFKRFQEIETEARRHADEAQSLAEQIKGKRAEAEAEVEALRKMTAEGISNDPKKAEQVAKSVEGNPEASVIEKAVANAVLLQRQEEIDEAIEKWRSIANIMAGTDTELAARAWFSIGYLYGKEKNDFEQAVDAFTKVIQLEPDDAAAYNNRGLAKHELGQHESAIDDCDKAISLKPNYADAYNNRGVAKDKLGQHESAIDDYDEAIHLKPDCAESYYNRGLTKHKLGQYKSAIADYDQAIQRKPDYAEAYFNRGVASWYLVERKEKTRQDLEKARSLAQRAGKKDLIADIELGLKNIAEGKPPFS